MAGRIHGSVPFKFNGRVIGKAYMVGQDDYGIIVDIRIDDTEVWNAVTLNITQGMDSGMSFHFIKEPDRPRPPYGAVVDYPAIGTEDAAVDCGD